MQSHRLLRGYAAKDVGVPLRRTSFRLTAEIQSLVVVEQCSIQRQCFPCSTELFIGNEQVPLPALPVIQRPQAILLDDAEVE